MSENIIPIKVFLGKYHTELLYSSAQDKYKNTRLDTFFEQRFYIQNNKVQMVVDPAATGLTAIVNGNEIHVSKELYDHPNITISNSLEKNHTSNPRSLYNAETFSTVAYLVCQNHTTFHVVGEVDEPIYIKYKSDYETFYNSVVVFNVDPGLEVEVVEEIQSFSALNSVTNYILNPSSKLHLTTFYQNNIAALSFVFRNVIAQDSSQFTHMLFGKGSSNVIDENKIHAMSNSSTEMYGIVDSDGRKFHSILYVEPGAQDYKISVNYKDILEDEGDVTFMPVIIGQSPEGEAAVIEVSSITLDELPTEKIEDEIKQFVSDIAERATLDRMVGVKRFYDNKSKFLHLL